MAGFCCMSSVSTAASGGADERAKCGRYGRATISLVLSLTGFVVCDCCVSAPLCGSIANVVNFGFAKFVSKVVMYANFPERSTVTVEAGETDAPATEAKDPDAGCTWKPLIPFSVAAYKNFPSGVIASPTKF